MVMNNINNKHVLNVSPKNRIGDNGEKKLKEMTQMNWQSTLALQGLHRAQEPTYDLYALVNWQRQLKTNWTTHTECFLFLWLLQSKYDGGYFTQIRPDRTRPIQSRLVLHYRAECDTVSRYLTYYLSGMFWREMSLVSLDTVNNHFLVLEHMGLEVVLRKRNSPLRDFERKQFSHLQRWETT